MQFTGDLPTAAESWSYVMVRWATFTSLVLLVGACVFLMVLQRALERPECRALGDIVRTRVRATGLAASLAVLALAPARVLLQQRVLSDALGDGTRIALGDLLGGDWGVGVALQLVAGGVGAVAFARTLGGMRCLGMGVALAAAAFVPAFSGHAAGATSPALPILADAVHVLAAGAWAGSLVIIATVVLPSAYNAHADEAAAGLQAILRAFTPVALGGASLLAITGAYAGVSHVGSISGLTSTRYGSALLWKLGLVGAMLVVGALNWKRIGPSAHTRDGMPKMWRSALLEGAIALAILFVTALLVARGTPVDLGE